MTRLYGMCGLAFSGKSTLAKDIARLTGAAYLGLDAINEGRGLRGGEGIPPDEWEKTSLVAAARAGALLDAGGDVVLDDTLCFRWLRARYAAVAERHRASFVLVYVATPLPEIYRAMTENKRTRHRDPIRPAVFAAHAQGFEPPAPDEHPVVYDRTLAVEAWVAHRLLPAQPPA